MDTRIVKGLEISQSTDVDAEVEGWLQLAWDAAG